MTSRWRSAGWRVAADHKDDVADRSPKPPRQKNGKRVACIGAARVTTVANDRRRSAMKW